jgi:hypothetical protein
MLEKLSETLQSIDNSLKRLVQIAETQNTATEELGSPKADFTIKGTRTRGKTTVPTTSEEMRAGAVPETAATTASPSASTFESAEGDPVGTRYFIIDKHNSVARVLPGEHAPSISGMVEVNGNAYLHAKVEQAKKSLTVQPQATVAQTAAPAASTAATTSTTSATAVGASTASSSEQSVSFEQVVGKLMMLAQDPREGMGRPAVTTFLAKHLPNESKPRVPVLESLGKHAELLAEVEQLLNPVAANTVADDIFG